MKSVRHLTALLALVTGTLFAVPASAEEATSMLDGPRYVGLGLSPIRFSADGESVRPTAGLIRAGLVAMQGMMEGKFDVAIEVQAGFGLHDDKFPDPRNEARLDSIYGVYLKPEYKWREFLAFYGAYGYSDAELEITGPGGQTFSESGNGYGAGARLNIAPAISVDIGYNEYLDEDTLKAEGVSIVVNYRLGVESDSGGYGY